MVKIGQYIFNIYSVYRAKPLFTDGKMDILSVFLFFHFGLTARQDYFTHFEPSQSLGGEKTGDRREKPPDHPQVELGLSHM